jgi:hypothetical protein
MVEKRTAVFVGHGGGGGGRRPGGHAFGTNVRLDILEFWYNQLLHDLADEEKQSGGEWFDPESRWGS